MFSRSSIANPEHPLNTPSKIVTQSTLLMFFNANSHSHTVKTEHLIGGNTWRFGSIAGVMASSVETHSLMIVLSSN